MPHNASSRTQMGRERALDVIRFMRSGRTFKQACRIAHTDTRTARKYAGNVLTNNESGRVRAAKSDQLTRRLNFLTPAGPEAVSVRGSRKASRVARHAIAADHYLNTGDAALLDEFIGEQLKLGKRTLPFLTDLLVLDRLGNANQVSYENLYARAA